MSYEPARAAPTGRQLFALALGAVGVVYGDIGTSPLYAMRECFHGVHAIAATRENVLGVLSLIFWSLILIVSIKYLVFVMRADNRGEGGMFALLALMPRDPGRPRRIAILTALGIFGAALIYGEGMITPAISVLSAVEGLKLATPAVAPYVVPITIAILVALFMAQRRGTAGIGNVFGPVMVLWFLTIGGLGAVWLARDPHVLVAFSPTHAVDFFLRNGVHAFFTLGAVFLVVTGAEALYADMGHFGKRPIRAAWFALVLPALALNYAGQGVLLLHQPEAADNPFYRLAPAWALYPLIGLATAAAVIASQALISGAFSLTRQAVQLGYTPRLEIVHTSEEEIGQIYIPTVNWVLMIFSIGLVLGFRESTRLAAAYGIAVTLAMVITTNLAYAIARGHWGLRRRAALPVFLVFLAIDLAFVCANVLKVADGGWFPLAVGFSIYTLMSTWKRGRQLLADRLARGAVPFEQFVASIQPESPPRVPGTAVFMSRDPQATPASLLHNLKHNKVLHERVILLTVMTEEVPYVEPKDRIEVTDLGKGFYRVCARYGFLQHPRMPDILERVREKGLDLQTMHTTFFLSRETLIPSRKRGMAIWRERLFWLMARNSLRPTDFFRIPPNRVVELGMQIRL